MLIPVRGKATMTLQVVVADDDPQVLAALAAVFEGDERFEVVDAVTNGHDAVASAAARRPQVVLLDVRMPGGGLVAVEAIVQAGEPLPTLVVLSARFDEALTADLVRAGVRGVLLKGRAGRDLPDLVLRCWNGEVLVVT
jgi:DNA-binding NarL/FixJ family response regulator